MALNFNVKPYYDDFDSAKNYHRILFKPGAAVQARELTQSQTILQDQITKFADHVFQENSPVTGGKLTTNFNCSYIKLNETFQGSTIDVTQFDGLLVSNDEGTVLARVIAVSAPTGTTGVGDPPTLIVSYQSGVQFNDGDIIYDTDSNLACQAIALEATGLSSTASIDLGVFYVEGCFVQVNPQTIILSKYDNTPSVRVGLNVLETVEDYVGDTTLLDPALGSTNYQAPGADRYKISLTLETRPLAFGDDENFIQLAKIEDGNLFKLVDGSVYATIDDYFAKRDYETNGDYIVSDFRLTPRTNPNDDDSYLMTIGTGLAYVRGYRVENPLPIDLTSTRARTTASQNNNPVFINYGSYLYIDNVAGANGEFFDVTTHQKIDFHCVDSANVILTNANTYNSTLVATGYIRALEFDDNATDTDLASYVYKAHVYDIQNNVLSANVVSATLSTITFPSNFSTSNTSYVGINISLTRGANAGEFRTITAYNGVTKTATLNSNWSSLPDTTTFFELNFDTKDIESIIQSDKTSYPATLQSKGNINVQSRSNGLSTGDTVIENSTVPEMLFPIGNEYVSSLTDTSYTTEQVFRGVGFTSTGSGVSAQLSFDSSFAGVIRHLGAPGSTLSDSTVRENFTIICTNKGTNASLNVGDIVPFTTAGRAITLSGDGSVATLTATDLTAFSAKIIEQVFVTNADNTSHIVRVKNLIEGNTTSVITSNTSGTQVNTYTFVDNSTLTSSGQIYIEKSGLVSPGQPQSLYLSDVKRIVKIIDTKDANTLPISSMLSSASNDITSFYNFDNGQKDNFYDHATITLKPGAPQPIGNILVVLDYYQHSGGDGYFSKMSYVDLSTSPEEYEEIGSYQATNGFLYQLRDCLDFRPARVNASVSEEFRFSNPGNTEKFGTYLPVDASTFIGDYSYYLGRWDKLVLTKDKNFQIIQGSPSLNPNFPPDPDGALLLANLRHTPYTGYLPTEAPTGVLTDLSVETVKHKRYTMSDISELEQRIVGLEYYTSLNLLEQSTNSLQVQDSLGLNRFKNGILVDDFGDASVAYAFNPDGTPNPDFNASINTRTKSLTAPQSVKNYPLKDINLAYNFGKLAANTANALGYTVNTDGMVNYFSLPFSESEIASQKLASRLINANPFAVVPKSTEGVLSLSPNVDPWVDVNGSPKLLTNTVDQLDVLSKGDWQSITGAPVTTITSQIYYNYKTPNSARNASTLTYAINNGFVTNVAVLPYIRKQQIMFRAKGLLQNSNAHSFFDGTNVDAYIRRPNNVFVKNVVGTVREGDVLAWSNAGNIVILGIVLGVHKWDATYTRLVIGADSTISGWPSFYINGSLGQWPQDLQLYTVGFDTVGNWTYIFSQMKIESVQHYSGRIVSRNSATNITLPPVAGINGDVLNSGAFVPNNISNPVAVANDYLYAGKTLRIVAGAAAGKSAVIESFNDTTKVMTLVAPGIPGMAAGDIYSISYKGGIANRTDKLGYTYGIFYCPGNVFPTGTRVFHIDDRPLLTAGTQKTFADCTFYAAGLQNTSTAIEFGASPSSSKQSFTSSNGEIPIGQTPTGTIDPVAQLFTIDKINYPSGAFISSAKFFFQNKPKDNSPITLSIVGTLNGQPNGKTLDHSIVTLLPSEVNVSDTPNWNDSTTYTEFKFSVPMYIQPGVPYAFMFKTNSNQWAIWEAYAGDNAIASSVKNAPSDPTPTNITKISATPYVGGMFSTQNSITWTPEVNRSLMFVLNRCVFNTTVQPNIRLVVPKKLPERTIIEYAIDYYNNPNTAVNGIESTSNSNIYVDAFNLTTTDFTPTNTLVNYKYSGTLLDGRSDGVYNINPGKYGTTMLDHIYLNDGKGQRLLDANISTSMSMYAQLSSIDNRVSPIVSDAGATAYVVQFDINNCELSNNLITITNGGAGYNANTTSVTISAPTGRSGTQAFASANVSSNGVISNIYITNGGSGYIQTPTITISDANTTPGTGATAVIAGETSKNGGSARTKYITKKVSLDAGFDSGDLNVYLSAYRPINTDILVYYKILNRNDNMKFDDSPWQLMTKIKNSDSLYSLTRNEIYEYVFAPGTGNVSQGYVSYTSTNGQTYTKFSQFAIKIVLTTSDKTYVPFINDMRSLALPSDVNITV
jgi:hypothetical protein